MAESHRSAIIGRRPLLAAGVTAGALGMARPFIVSARGETPIKIGMVDPETGTYAALGDNEINGAKLAIKQVNAKGGILGRQVALIVQDSAANVSQSVQKANELIERDKVNFLIGAVSSAVAEAMSQTAHNKNMLYVVTGGHTDSVTGSQCHWNTFRICSTTYMLAAAVAKTLANKYRQELVFHYAGLCLRPYRAGGFRQTAHRHGRQGARQFARSARHH